MSEYQEECDALCRLLNMPEARVGKEAERLSAKANEIIAKNKIIRKEERRQVEEVLPDGLGALMDGTKARIAIMRIAKQLNPWLHLTPPDSWRSVSGI